MRWAEGAAIQAGMIQGSIRPEDGIVMTDVNPYTLGIRAMDDMTDDRMSVVIPRKCDDSCYPQSDIFYQLERTDRCTYRGLSGRKRSCQQQSFSGRFCGEWYSGCESGQ